MNKAKKQQCVSNISVPSYFLRVLRDPVVNSTKRRLISTMSLAFACAAVIGCAEQPPELGPLPRMNDAKLIRVAFTGGETGDLEAGADAAPVGTGWGTLKGRITFASDERPQMPPYGVNKDQAVCSPDNRTPLQETLLVDSATGGIKNVAIYLRSASRVHESAGPSTEPVVFDQKECVFQTHVFPVTVGQPIDLKNSDPVMHNTNISGKRNSVNPAIPGGETLRWVAQREEATPAPVSCSVHPWMRAYVLPRENAYVAVTAEDGSFEIPNLPAGEPLELQVWHESATGAGGSLIVNTPEAKELKWTNKGRFTVQLEENGTKEIQVAVPPSAFKI